MILCVVLYGVVSCVVLCGEERSGTGVVPVCGCVVCVVCVVCV